MSFAEEFAAVDLIVHLGLATSGIDAFALSLIKAERQVRRLFTHLVYQCPAFALTHVPTLRATLVKSGRCYFEGFERGFDALYPRTVADLVGPEYVALRARLNDAIGTRNKVFHGQLTNRNLCRTDLLEYVRDIRRWCELLAESANREIGYDGFKRNSFRKGQSNLSATYRLQLADVGTYARLLEEYVERPARGHEWRPPVTR